MLRKLWAQDKKFDWDEPIPETFRQEWIKLFKEFAQVKHITFERSTTPSDAVGDGPFLLYSQMGLHRHMEQLHTHGGNLKIIHMELVC